MKFCKVLQQQQEENFPELNHMFLRYKILKKKIKAIPSTCHAARGIDSSPGPTAAACNEHDGASTSGCNPLSQEEQAFITALNEDLKMFNDFFMEKEEDAVIKIQALSDQLQQAVTNEQLKDMKGRLVNFHGELVLILHWSLINYSAVVKILKKHDKRTGLLLRAPYIANVLKQPFASTSVMSRLVKRAEEMVERAGALLLQTPSAPGAAAAAAAQAPLLQYAAQQQQRGQVSSDDEGSTLTEVPEHWSAPRMAEKTELVLELWQSLAKSASTPSTILQMSAGAQAAAGRSRCAAEAAGSEGEAAPVVKLGRQQCCSVSDQSVDPPPQKRARRSDEAADE